MDSRTVKERAKAKNKDKLIMPGSIFLALPPPLPLFKCLLDLLYDGRPEMETYLSCKFQSFVAIVITIINSHLTKNSEKTCNEY